jgi:phosphomevalonate kinase
VSVVVRAPGKAILCGEYAVLHGAPAIAVAVDRCVVVSDGNDEPSPFVAAALRHAGAGVERVHVDSSALYEGADKLGLGSSAAVTAAVVGWAKRDLLRDKAALFALADAAHAEGQGTRGSGIDVACSVYGGTIRFVRKNGAVDVREVDLPDGVRLTFLWAEKPASTANLLGRVKALAEAQPARHEAAIARLISHAHAFATAVNANDADGLVRAADAYGHAMAALGDAAGCEIVTKPHTQLAALARRHGGAAKPSGAGGGDLGVAFTIGNEATQRLREDARAAGLTLLSLGAPAPGLRLENA